MLKLRQHALEIPEDTIPNMGIHGSIAGKTMTRIICFDRITTATRFAKPSEGGGGGGWGEMF